MQKTNPLGVDSIIKLILRFSIPAIVGMMVNALYNIVDRIFIGNSKELGTNGLAAITISFPIMIFILAVGVLFGVGGATVFSIRQGEGKNEEAEKTLGNAFILLGSGGLLSTILGLIFLKPLLIAFGASPEVLPYAIEYMTIIFIGTTFNVIGIGLNNFVRADGSPKIAMLTMFLGAGLNTILDPLFIYTFKMGMKGAAIATIFSQFVSSVWVIYYFIGKSSRHKLKVNNLKLEGKLVLLIVSLGMPNFMLQLANSLLNVILNKSLHSFGGDIAVSGMGVVNSIQTLLLMPLIGLNQGVQPIISFNFGAKRYDRVKTAIKHAIFAATSIVILGYLLTRFFPSQLVSLFNQEPDLLDFGKRALFSWFLCLPLIGFQVMAANFFQAIGRAKSAMFLTLTRQIILLIPAILVFSRLWGLKGILFAAPFADLLSFILTLIWFIIGMKSLKEEI